MPNNVPSDAIEVRPFNQHEGDLLKQTRLTALAESPHAFSSSIEYERSLPDEYWSDLAQGKGQFAGSRSFLAKTDAKIVAMAGCYAQAEHTYRLVAMWVDPQVRGRGVGAAILDAVEAWAKRQGAVALAAAVFDTNAHAMAFYARQGFKNFALTCGENRDDKGSELELLKQLA